LLVRGDPGVQLFPDELLTDDVLRRRGNFRRVIEPRQHFFTRLERRRRDQAIKADERQSRERHAPRQQRLPTRSAPCVHSRPPGDPPGDLNEPPQGSRTWRRCQRYMCLGLAHATRKSLSCQIVEKKATHPKTTCRSLDLACI